MQCVRSVRPEVVSATYAVKLGSIATGRHHRLALSGPDQRHAVSTEQLETISWEGWGRRMGLRTSRHSKGDAAESKCRLPAPRRRGKIFIRLPWTGFSYPCLLVDAVLGLYHEQLSGCTRVRLCTLEFCVLGYSTQLCRCCNYNPICYDRRPAVYGLYTYLGGW
ncbi:hypothetical protein GQ44DRAFT_702586 [Phaeosphaeriaceae sp. PMI808]|nr:hypothetical protein GQ44DRAFT_702586 [Phaeosphaeriaceae sp. PMI808]